MMLPTASISIHYNLHVLLLQWDEALLTMSLGEKAQITIEPEWAYGKRGHEGKYPFHSCNTYNITHW